MVRLMFVAGPPASAAMWADLSRRIESEHGIPAEAVELFSPAPEDPTVAGLARGLAERLNNSPPCVLVAHGTAVPVAWRAASHARPAGLVLSNGPVRALDPILKALSQAARSPRLLAETVLRPVVLQRWLASSAGLRRTVVNPYVMDRDTVVRLSDPILATPEQRRAVAVFLRDLAKQDDVPPRYDGPTLLCWGDGDPLYPAAVAEEALGELPRGQHVRVPGGQHFHPVERPWYMADEVADWLARASLSGPTMQTTT